MAKAAKIRAVLDRFGDQIPAQWAHAGRIFLEDPERTNTDIAKRAGVAQGVVSHRLDKLEKFVGRRPTLTDPDTLAAARARQANGESYTEIAKALGVSRSSLYLYLPPPYQPGRSRPTTHHERLLRKLGRSTVRGI